MAGLCLIADRSKKMNRLSSNGYGVCLLEAKCAQNARNHAFWAKNINRILKNIGLSSGEGCFWNFSAQKHSFFEAPFGLYPFL